MVLGLFAKKSTQKSETTNEYENIKRNISNIMSNSTQETLQTAKNSNKLKIDIENMYPGCTLDSNQTIQSSQISIAKVTQNLSDTLKEDIQKDLEQKADSVLEKKTDVVGTLGSIFGGGTDQEVISNVKTSIRDVTEKTFDATTLQDQQQKVKNENKKKLKIKNCRGPIDLKQEIMNSQFSESISDQLLSNMKDSKLDFLVETEASGDVSQEDTTVSSVTDMISSIFEGYVMVMGSSVCMMCLCCAAVLAFMLSPAGQNMARNTNVGGIAQMALSKKMM